MATIQAVRVACEVTVQARQYEPLKMFCEMSANLDDGDNPETVIDELTGRIRAVQAQQLAVLPFPAAKSMARDLLKDLSLPDDIDF